MSHKPKNILSLKELSGEWKSQEWLAHLPSLRNQQAQALVNKDLTSIGWLAATPFAMGYHTGTLRVDGEVLACDAFRWSAYEASRRVKKGDLRIESASRMVFEENGLLWRIQVTNEGKERRSTALDLDCFAMFSRSEINWGWLYGQPWKNGIRHDYLAMEKLRQGITDRDDHGFMLTGNPRPIEIGIPHSADHAIDLDEEKPMLCETELPQHVSDDARPPEPIAMIGEVRALRIFGTADFEASSEMLSHDEVISLKDEAASFQLPSITLPDTVSISLSVKPEVSQQRAVVFSHGDQPDSLRLSIAEGCLRLDMGGDYVLATEPLALQEWSQIGITFDGRTATLTINAQSCGQTSPWWDAEQWQGGLTERGLEVTDTASDAVACYAFATAPNQLVAKGSGANATWSLELEPGESAVIEWVLSYGSDHQEVLQNAEQWSAGFDTVFDSVATRYEQRWQDMFDPQGGFFSGHLPSFETPDEELKRVYYMGALTLLYLHHSKLPVSRSTFLTGGPRLGATTTYYWDVNEWPGCYALLEPEGMKEWLRFVLTKDIDACFGIDNYSGIAVGNGYVANYHSLFNIMYHYLSVTGDLDFLSEAIAGRNVKQHLHDMALNWERLTSPQTGGRLADFGADHWNLLECVPNYKHVVASFNAGYVWMMDKMAEIYQRLGDAAQAAEFISKANQLSEAVLELSDGKGRWYTVHPNKTETVHHVLDFVMVSRDMKDRLSPKIKKEMAAFVQDELLTDNFMRAQSQQDPVAEYSDRPDHGPNGAFAAWPGATAFGLANLGDYDDAVAVLKRLHGVSYEGCGAQAWELFQHPERQDAPVRIAERGASNRESAAAAASAEGVIFGLFGFDPSALSATSLPLRCESEKHGKLSGVLSHLSYQGQDFKIMLENGKLTKSEASSVCATTIKE